MGLVASSTVGDIGGTFFDVSPLEPSSDDSPVELFFDEELLVELLLVELLLVDEVLVDEVLVDEVLVELNSDDSDVVAEEDVLDDDVGERI